MIFYTKSFTLKKIIFKETKFVIIFIQKFYLKNLKNKFLWIFIQKFYSLKNNFYTKK